MLIGGRRPTAAAFVIPSAPAVLARLPLRPAEPGPAGPPDGVLAEAMFLASRQAPTASSTGPAAAPSRRELTRRAYDLRSRWRPTPHGAFSAVATARIAGKDEPDLLRLGEAHRGRTNPSGAWLAAFCDQVMADPDVGPLLVDRLHLTASNLIVRRGQALENVWRTRRVTVRATAASVEILRLCSSGASGSGVVDAVMRRWPVPASVVRAALLELVRGGFLLADLLPARITEDPLGHLAGKIGPEHAAAPHLTRLRRLLSDADRHRVGDPARLPLLVRARDVADGLCLVDRPLSVDVAADADIAVPAALLAEAARAATALWRATDPMIELAEWHQRFVTRYRPGRLVPLLEATDAATGLGIDSHRIEPHRRPDEQAAEKHALAAERRHHALAELVAGALTGGRTEIILDEATLTRLDGGRGGLPACPAEISVRVISSSSDALAAGRWELAVVPPGPQRAGTTIGRFARLLPDAWPGPSNDGPGPLIAEIVADACVPNAAALAPPTGFTRYRIPVGVADRPGDLDPVLDVDLADLHLVSDGRRLTCWSVRHNQQVIPVLYSRLAAHLLPPIARFLQLLGHSGTVLLTPWCWGPTAAGPFQPRIRYGRTILTPARWFLPPSLAEAAHGADLWRQALQAWRTTTLPAPPDVVVTDDGDHRLPLDLRRADDRELLRRYVRRGLRAVCEPPGGPDAVQAVATGPGGRHVLELVIPVEPRPRPSPGVNGARAHPPPRTADEGLFLPGGPWLSLHLPAPRTCQDEVLEQLAVVNRELEGHFASCFWLRYTDPVHGPHLRIRFHGQPAALGGVVLPVLSEWCAELKRQHLASAFTVQSYDQEIERYGGTDAIAAAERVFAADSSLVLALLPTTGDSEQRVVAAALSAAAITTAIADGDPAALDRHHLDRTARRRFQSLRAAVRAAGRQHDGTMPPDTVWAGSATDLWTARHTALTAYRAAVRPTQRPTGAGALTHMHANRLLGDADAERIATALAADLLALNRSTTSP
ncbi:lantibiotic dehydratase [Actinocorallia sp. API 0066]|uniref:lantibiotic dehydratase n=1 Tax=Actinocorallia sp. API 0066 TaxID=2896846 RepID=UPI001E374648|nr:lantibiotic dehydratase [Actinocorallia sp. API 0066]MCD0449106.1 lantibiotic dehydratase [Actinocorallia sp. API 0066]